MGHRYVKNKLISLFLSIIYCIQTKLELSLRPNKRPFMEFIEIYPPYIYSVKYEGNDENEFDRLFNEWNDMELVMDFLMQNKEYLNSQIWNAVKEPEMAARQVLDEAEKLEDLFEILENNTKRDNKPDYDSFFKCLDGKYQYELEYIPMKLYGSNRPSLLRMYAIKLEDNVYIITGGGIKLSRTIQESPGINKNIIHNIDMVRAWLKKNGILTTDDLLI